MAHRYYLITDKSYVLPLFDAGVPIYMVDFDEEDPQNMAKQMASREMFTPEKLSSKNTFFYKKEDEKQFYSRSENKKRLARTAEE